MTDMREALEEIAHGGWPSIDDARKVVSEAAKQRRLIEDARERETKRMVRAALISPEGKALLTWLEDNTVKLRPQADELNAVTAEAYAIAKARREGQNAIVFKIWDLLADPSEEETPT